MKRLCTKQEQEVLYKNRKQMIKGKYGTASNGRWSDFFVSCFFAVIIAMGILIYVMVTDLVDLTKSRMKLIISLCILLVYSIIAKIMSWIRRKREEKRFKARDDIMVNGATIVEVDLSGNFAYIEDDFYDENGRPIILDYPFSSKEIKLEDIGKRILVLYDGDFGYRLVILNDELRGLIPNITYEYPLKENIHSYMRVPHSNMVNLEKTEHDLSESEKKFFADFYMKETQRVQLKAQKVGTIILVICIVLMSVLLGIGKDGYPISKCIMFGVTGFVGLAAFLGLITFVKMKIMRKRSEFVSVKKVVFVAQGVRNKLSVVKVFEWHQNQVQLSEYPSNELPANTAYGSVLYKLVNPKGKIVLLNEKPVM